MRGPAWRISRICLPNRPPSKCGNRKANVLRRDVGGAFVSESEPLQRRDYLLVALFALTLYSIVLTAGGPLTLHEGVLAQTTKAMLANHDWLVPRYGDAPWLERPPLPQWISCAICAVIGHCDAEWNVRIGSALSGL